MTALPLIYNKLKVAVCLHFSEIAFFSAFPWHAGGGALCVLSQHQNEKSLLPFLAG